MWAAHFHDCLLTLVDGHVHHPLWKYGMRDFHDNLVVMRIGRARDGWRRGRADRRGGEGGGGGGGERRGNVRGASTCESRALVRLCLLTRAPRQGRNESADRGAELVNLGIRWLPYQGRRCLLRRVSDEAATSSKVAAAPSPSTWRHSFHVFGLHRQKHRLTCSPKANTMEVWCPAGPIICDFP